MATGAIDTPDRDLRLAALVAGSRRLIGALEHLYHLGTSHHGSLYDRQNLGAATDRIALGPPGRSEFNPICDTQHDVVNLATLRLPRARHRSARETRGVRSIGVVGRTGRGVCEHFGIDPRTIDIRIGTLSKAIPSVGGFAAVHAHVGAILRYASHARVFSAAMTPSDAAAALAGLEVLALEPERVARLQHNAALFRSRLGWQGLDTFGSETSVVPVRVADRLATLAIAHTLLDRGVYVNPILSPGVPVGSERLRCFVTTAHSEADLLHAADTIADVIRGGRSRATAVAARSR